MINKISDLFLEHTPIETHTLNGKTIDVKREDLYCSDMIAPLAKMRGVHIVMNRLKKEGITNIGVFDFKVSKAGVGIAAMSKLLNLNCYEFYQHYKAYNTEGLPQQQIMCQKWGATLHPIKAAQIQINYNMAKKALREIGNGYMFPKGIILEETIEAVANEVDHDRNKLKKYNNIVICAGSGTISTGLIKGLLRNNLQPNIYAVCCTNAVQHCKRLHKEIKENKDLQKINIEILPAEIEYYSECNIETPFPSHPNYDKKAWYWLSKNNIEGETLFWNIGG